MRKLILSLALFVLFAVLTFETAGAFGHGYNVRGYYKGNGTYVRPYRRTRPDSRLYNNYGYRGGMTQGQRNSMYGFTRRTWSTPTFKRRTYRRRY